MILFNLITTIHSLRPSPCELMGSISLCPSPSRLQLAILYITLGLASLGVGGIRFTIATMGAAQFDKPKNQRAFLSLYFLAFYVANGTGLTAMIYIEDNVGWNLAFRICLVSNVIALKRNISGTFGNRDYYYGSVETTNILGDGSSKSLRWLNRAALKVEGDHERQSNQSNARSWKLCTVQEVEDLKTLVKIIPFWSSSILLSATLSMFTNMVILQALTMDRHIGPHFQVSASSFIVFNLISIAFSLLIIDFFIIPTWKKFFPNRPLTLIPRIGIGHVINILGLAASALIERRRLHVVRTHRLSSISIVPMSALWLLVPLGVLGIGEALHFTGNIMLYYQEFPKSIKNSAGAMVAAVLGIGYYLIIAITDLVQKTTGWLSNNINNGRLDNVYWMLAVIGVVNFGYYLICAYKYRYVEKSNDNPNDSLG
ncbi:Proton-dependent oligopeptide transporter family [Corchorus olitorius]|uniref:Proton-dependent oligopeptide transporter family n=1 Tax=Corchorus olitorius TaxID=93759 RepID=A0A1R3IET2_9ROSI|nr:Proton-dependent oligopeptide transporter family [Corchorus olitorius]